MNKEDLIKFLKENLTVIKSYGVTSLALFGSFARDEAKSSSDIDLLVEFEGVVTFDKYMDLKFFLEDETIWDIIQTKIIPLKSEVETIIHQEFK